MTDRAPYLEHNFICPKCGSPWHNVHVVYPDEEKGNEMAWGLEGRHLSIGWALALTYDVGFRDKNQLIAVALMTAESGRYAMAWHENIVDGVVDSVDRGLFQINGKWHPTLKVEEAYSAIPNAEYAYHMSQGKFFKPWMAYVNNAHLKYLPLVWAVKVLGRWKRKVPRVAFEFPRDQVTQ